MKISGIYCIISPSNKVYIGQSWDIKARFSQHRREKRPILVLNRSIHKYGWVNHKARILHELPPDVGQSVMDNYEQFYLDAFVDCGATLLNMKEAGARGKMSDTAKKKMSIANKGRKAWNKGLKGFCFHTEESKMIISKTHKGRKRIDSTKEKLRSKATGRKHTTETRLKMSVVKIGKPGAKLGYKCTPDQIEKIRLAKLGHVHSQETKYKISANHSRHNKGGSTIRASKRKESSSACR